MTKLNKALMASTAIAFACGLAFPASAQDPAAAPGVVSSGNKMKLKLYGQIARAFGFVGDGETVTFKQGENGNTSTRMGIDGRGKITNDVSVRTRMEFEVSSGDELGGTQFENQGGDASTFGVRHLDLIVESKKFGSVWIGRGDSSSNGTSEVQVIPALDSGRLGGSVHNLIAKLRVLDENENLGTRTVATVDRFFQSFDGANRQNRIRYDTPTFFGFKGSVSLIDKHNIDSAVFYEGKFFGIEIEGAVGFCHTRGAQSAGSGTCFGNDTTVTAVSQLNGSVSMLTPIGLGATMSGGHQWQALAGTGHTTEDPNPFNIQPAIFYTTKVTELGATTIEYAFQYCKHCGQKDDKGIGHSLQLMQQVDSVGGDYFVGFRYIDVETATNDNIDGLWFIGGGFRQRF